VRSFGPALAPVFFLLEVNMRYSLVLRFTAIAICASGCASVAFGADDGHGDGHGGGTPNPLAIFFDTALWTIVIFLGLLFILRKKAWGPILDGLQKREETIRSSIEEAKKTRAEMELLRANFQKEMAEAQQQIPRLMEEARKKGDEMVLQKLADAAAKIQAEQERFRHDMQTAKDQAIKELWEQAAQLATLISAKAIGRSLTDDDHRRLLDEALSEMRPPSNN
jgi:F-type H+-transporting ATPase subunit b